MTELTGKTVMTIYNLTVDNDTRADSCTESDHDEVLHSTSCTISHFTYCSRISVICKSYRHSAHCLRKKLGELHSVMSPAEVWSVLDSTCIIVSVRCTYTDTSDFSLNVCLFDHLLDSYCQFFDKEIHNVMIVSADYSLSKNSSSCVNNTNFGSLTSNVNTYYVHIILYLFRYYF